MQSANSYNIFPLTPYVSNFNKILSCDALSEPVEISKKHQLHLAMDHNQLGEQQKINVRVTMERT